jgi:hypothetical protein
VPSVYEGWGFASNDCNDPLGQFAKLGHFWKIKSIHGVYQYPTYLFLFVRRNVVEGVSREMSFDICTQNFLTLR